jgi:hypothetical protein
MGEVTDCHFTHTEKPFYNKLIIEARRKRASPAI